MNDLFISGGKKFLFWLYKRLNKKLLKKFFPFNKNDFNITIPNQSQVYINEKINLCYISFPILLKNYTNYDLFISLIQIELSINNFRFLNFDKVILRNFKPKEGTQLYLEIPFTYYQVRSIIQMLSEGTNILNATFILRISSKNIFGDDLFEKQLFEKFEVRYYH